MMNYRAFMGKVMEQLKEYKDIADRLAVAYTKEKAEFETELKSMESVYLPEHIETSRRNWKPKTDYGKQLLTARRRGGEGCRCLLERHKGRDGRIFPDSC